MAKVPGRWEHMSVVWDELKSTKKLKRLTLQQSGLIL